VKRQLAVLLLMLLPSPMLCVQSKSQTRGRISAEHLLRQYVEARLNWSDWKYYSQFITWPDEPAWDGWWVAKNYHIGKGLNEAAKRVIPVTYDRLGLFCLNFDWEPKSEAATVS
jgi:hypothetical protein